MFWRSTLRCRALCCCLAAILMAPLTARGAELSSSEIDKQVREALHREIYGLEDEKQEILEEIIAESPDAAAARWHLGYVRQGDEWVKPSASELPKADPRRAGYFFRRDSTEDTVAGHMEMADWCSGRGLDERARAHLSRVIQLNPDHLIARQRMGFVRVGADWIHRDEIRAARLAEQQRREDLTEWEAEADRLIRRLGSRSAAQRAEALKDIAELEKVDQVAILEMRFAPHSPEAAQAAILALGNMTDEQARDALARIALFSIWQPTRIDAADKLGKWPVESYVPMLLSEMYLPLQTEIQTTTDTRGRLIYRHVFTREGQDENQQMILDTAFRRRSRIGGNRNETLWRAMSQMGGQMIATQMAAMQQEAFTQEMNRRICDCLTVATGEQLPANPQWWWNWWDEYNEASVDGEKTTRVAYASTEIVVPDISRSSSAGGSGGGSSGSGSRQRIDCLVAGTLVWTDTGLKPIETILVGDMVLSQDVATGELAYKPVLRATVRSRGPLVRIKVGDETLESSGGHLFWVTGEGWVKASEMQSGVSIHGMEGSTVVSEVSAQPDQVTYNLVVADTHNYFITERKILSHDNTLRTPTKAIIPGLAP